MLDKRTTLEGPRSPVSRMERGWRSVATRCTGDQAPRSTRSCARANGSWRSSRRLAPMTSICSAAPAAPARWRSDSLGSRPPFGMAPSYRRTVERGTVEAKEHACYTVIAGLRAAIQGVPFMPVAGLTGSDVPARPRVPDSGRPPTRTPRWSSSPSCDLMWRSSMSTRRTPRGTPASTAPGLKMC